MADMTHQWTREDLLRADRDRLLAAIAVIYTDASTAHAGPDDRRDAVLEAIAERAKEELSL